MLQREFKWSSCLESRRYSYSGTNPKNCSELERMGDFKVILGKNLHGCRPQYLVSLGRWGPLEVTVPLGSFQAFEGH